MWDASKLDGLQIICATMTDQMLKEPCQAKKNGKQVVHAKAAAKLKTWVCSDYA